MRKAVVYARVSSKEQEQGFSIEAQLKAARRYAPSHQLTIVREFAQSESAKQQGRKQFGAMLEFLRGNPDCRVIIVEKTDRLSRNLHDFVAIEDFVEELKAEVHLIREAQIIRSQAKSQDRLVQGIFALLARNYIQNMQEEILKGQMVKAEKGQYPGRAPYGYMHNRESRTIEVDPKRGPTVTLLFELYATGAYAIPALRTLIRERTGEVISKSYCHRILKSRFYIGQFRWRETEYQGAHAPLVSHSTFQQVQDVLSGRNVNKCKPHKRSFPFSGLMRCIVCGCGLTAERHKGKYDYYRCSFSHGRHKFTYMNGKYVSDILATVVEEIQIPQTVVRQIVESIRSDSAGKEEKRQEQVSGMNQRLSALRTRMRKSYQDKLEGKIDEKFWSANMNDWMEQERQLETGLEAMSEPCADDPALSAQQILELAQAAHSIYLAGNDAERGELLRMILLNCETDGVSVSPHYRKPFEIIFQRGQNEEWRRGWDLNR